jgi:hypothetical protein
MQCGAHRLMALIPGFKKPLDAAIAIGRVLASHCIAAAASMVDDFGRKHKQ